MDQKIVKAIVDLFTSFFAKSDAPAPAPAPAAPKAEQPAQPSLVVDWNNPASKISKHFSVKEATELHSWSTFHKPTDDQKAAILGIAQGVDKACDMLEKALGRPVSVNVHAWMRPDHAICPGTQWDGQDYNKWIYWNEVWKNLTDAQKAEKHVPLSPHRTGHAVDFHIVGFEGPEGCAKIRQMLIPHLEELGLRMEDIVGGWVHLDNLPVVNQRFFKP